MTSDIQQLVEFQAQMASKIAVINGQGSAEIGKNEKGYEIYRKNILATATRSLSISYPVMTQMLGEIAIKILAKRLLEIAIPDAGDWTEWGSGLSALLQESELIDSLPFLPDMAKLEWCVHQVGRAKTIPVNLDSFQLIQQKDWSTIAFKLQSHLVLLSSAYPVAEIWRIHRPWDANYTPQAEELRRVIRKAESPFCFMVNQRDLRADVTSLTMKEFQLYWAVQQQTPLADLARKYTQSELAQWLEYSAANNQLIEVYIKPKFTI